MSKLKLMTFAPLSIIAVTLASVATIAMNKPGEVTFEAHNDKHQREKKHHEQSQQHENNHHADQKQHGGHYHSMGKPGTQVRLSGAQRMDIALNETKGMELTLDNAHTNGVMNVTLITDAGIEIVNAPSHYSFAIDVNKDEINLPLELKAMANGIHYLHVFIEHTSEEGAVTSRALAREIHVGVATDSKKHFAKAKGVQINTEQGLISMPAHESIY